MRGSNQVEKLERQHADRGSSDCGEKQCQLFLRSLTSRRISTTTFKLRRGGWATVGGNIGLPHSLGPGIQSMHEMQNLMAQIYHFELLVLLHLPYILQSPTEGRYDYSKAILHSIQPGGSKAIHRVSEPHHRPILLPSRG